MAVGPPPFENRFETTGRGEPDPNVLEAINKSRERDEWSENVMVLDHDTGKVITSDAFKKKYPVASHDIGSTVMQGRTEVDEKGRLSIAIAGRTVLTRTS